MAEIFVEGLALNVNIQGNVTPTLEEQQSIIEQSKKKNLKKILLKHKIQRNKKLNLL